MFLSADCVCFFSTFSITSLLQLLSRLIVCLSVDWCERHITVFKARTPFHVSHVHYILCILFFFFLVWEKLDPHFGLYNDGVWVFVYFGRIGDEYRVKCTWGCLNVCFVWRYIVVVLIVSTLYLCVLCVGVLNITFYNSSSRFATQYR